MSNAKSKPWIRLYRESLHDPKIVSLTDRQHRAWHNLLLIADDNGKLPSMRDIAVHLRMSAQDAEQLVCDLVEAELIDTDVLNGSRAYEIHGWASRQFTSDSSTERVRKHRETRMKRFNETERNVTVTPPDTESDTETETEKIESAHARKDRVWLNDKGEINFTDSYRDEWINDPDFFDGDAASFKCAVKEARPYVRPNGTPLEAQLSRQLAMRCRDRRERDKRYQSAQQPKQSIVLDAERWAAIERRAAEIGG